MMEDGNLFLGDKKLRKRLTFDSNKLYGDTAQERFKLEKGIEGYIIKRKPFGQDYDLIDPKTGEVKPWEVKSRKAKLSKLQQETEDLNVFRW